MLPLNKIYLIVEGDGEVTAAPELLRRILFEKHNRYVEFARPYNASGRQNILKPHGLEHFLELTRGQPDCAGVMVLLDAESDYVHCPPKLEQQLTRRARKMHLPFPTVIVCAACEYESWFLADVGGIKRAKPAYLQASAAFNADPDQKCNAKEWLTAHMLSTPPAKNIYKETQDQVRLTARLNFDTVQDQSRSFQRLLYLIKQLLNQIDQRGQQKQLELPL